MLILKIEFILNYVLKFKMTSFPLYNNIKKKIQADIRPFSGENKKNIQKMFKKCSKESHELIFALIKCFQNDNNLDQNLNIPFSGKVLKSGIKFDINNFPLKLQHIIFEFIKMDLNKNK